MFVSASAISFAQEGVGRVGINTESPRATMEITPSKKNNEDTATTNEGLIIPQLSKTRVANIENKKLVKGTLIYVKETTSYKGSNPKVDGIDAPGFYHYNGSQWEKGVGGGGTGTSAVAENIYTADGTLSGKRTIDMDYSPIIFKKGRIGIDINTDLPQADLDVNGTVRVDYLPKVEDGEDFSIVVSGKNEILKKVSVSDAFKAITTLNTAYYGLESGTLKCDKDNDRAVYLLPQGSLHCSQSMRSDDYFWWYTGIITVNGEYCKDSTDTRIVFTARDIPVKGTENYLMIKKGKDTVVRWNQNINAEKYYLIINEGRVSCPKDQMGYDFWGHPTIEITTALKVR